MRIDKFLKLSRVIKRRTVAKDVALHDLIYLNDKLAKPSSTVKIGDTITLNFAKHTLNIKVLSLNPKESMVSVIEE